MTILDWTAQQILACDIAEKLFDKDRYEDQFMRLRSKWHPDRNKSKHATDVFQHLVLLAEEAKSKIATDTWAGAASIQFTTHDGKTFNFKYLAMREIEIGKVYIGKRVLMYVVDPGNEDLFTNGIKMIDSIKYPSNEFKQEFSRFLPTKKLVDKNSSIGMVAVFEKPEGTVLLQDLIEYMSDQQIPPKHTAWITSSLYNIAAFLDHVGLCHNAITPTNIFVDPAKHGVFLLGGWWYATKTGDKLKAVPSELLKVLPKEVFDTKTAQTRYDRKAIKGVGIGCLGDPTLVGSKLLTRKDIPKPMLSWLRSASSSTAPKEYKGWMEALEQSFGKRKFIEFNVDVNDVYSSGGK